MQNTEEAKVPTLYHATNLIALVSIAHSGLREGTYVTKFDGMVDYYAETISDEGHTPVTLEIIPLPAAPLVLAPDTPGIYEPISTVLRNEVEGFDAEALIERWEASDKSGAASLEMIGCARIMTAIPAYQLVVSLESGEKMTLDDFLSSQGIHLCDSTGEAYDMSQCDEAVRRGHTLVIPSEGVVGLADTWPIAVTVEAGELHAVADANSYLASAGITHEQVQFAEAVAHQLNMPVDDWVAKLGAPTAKRGLAP